MLAVFEGACLVVVTALGDLAAQVRVRKAWSSVVSGGRRVPLLRTGTFSRRTRRTAGQPRFGRSGSRSRAVVISNVQGQWRARRRMRRRPVVRSCPAAENRRNRMRRGSQSVAWPVRASIGIQASRSSAIWTISSRTLFCGGVVQGQVPQAGRPGGPGPDLRAGPQPVTECEFGDRTVGGVGGEAGDPHAVRVGDPQLGPGMGSFLADDQPHALWPAVEQVLW